MSHTTKRAVFALWTGTALTAAIMSVTSAQAAGALAIGLQNDDPKPGIAAGAAWSHPSEGEAKYKALANCLSYEDAPLEVRVSCKVVATFQNQCFAIAFDPEPGTPGFGWAIGKDKKTADKSALDKCKAAGGERAQYCAIALADCDASTDVVAQAPTTSTPLAAPTDTVTAPSKSTGRRK